MKSHASKLRISLILSICVITVFSLVYPVAAAATIVKAEASISQPEVGDTLTVDIKILNAQDLFGVDVTINWNSSVLELQSATSQLGVESHPNGVLHESNAYPIEVIANDASQSDAEYHLSATSTGSSTPTFDGSGTIATVVFKAVGKGPTGLVLNDVEISQLNTDGTADLVTPSTTVDPVNVPVPEFPTIILIVLVLVAATATAVLSTKLLKNRSSIQKPF